MIHGSWNAIATTHWSPSQLKLFLCLTTRTAFRACEQHYRICQWGCVYSFLLFVFVSTWQNQFVKKKILQQLVSYRCVTATEVYDQTLNTQSHLCRHLCIGRDGCSVANYDVAMGTCLLTQEKCIDVVTDLTFELTYFRSITKDKCLHWTPISEFDINKAVTSEHCSFIPADSRCHVGRLLSPPNILPAKFQPAVLVRIVKIWTVLNGVHANSAYQDDAGEVLQVHSECNVFWKPFNALNDSLPEYALKGGYLASSDSDLYIMRAPTPGDYTVFGYYDPVARRGYLEDRGVYEYTQMEILVFLLIRYPSSVLPKTLHAYIYTNAIGHSVVDWCGYHRTSPVDTLPWLCPRRHGTSQPVPATLTRRLRHINHTSRGARKTARPRQPSKDHLPCRCSGGFSTQRWSLLQRSW